MKSVLDTARELIRTDPALAAEIVRQMSPQPVGGLTPRQRDVLDFIRSHQGEHGVTPTYDEIAAGIGLSSKSGIARMIDGLEERGFVTRLPGRWRSIVLREIAA